MNFDLAVNEETLKGKIIIKVPSYTERMDLVKSLNLRIGLNGDVDLKNDAEAISSAKEIFIHADKFVVAVDVVAEGNGFSGKISTLEELGMFEEGAKIITEKVAAIIYNGIKLGKN
jgi:hypothetical protein